MGLNLDTMAPRTFPMCLETLLAVVSRRATTGMEQGEAGVL